MTADSIELDMLHKIPLFSGLLPVHLKTVAAIIKVQTLVAGTEIFSAGDIADSFCFLVKGQVRITQKIPGVGEEALAILDAGDYFGEMALIDEEPRSAYAICNTSVILGSITREDFHHLLFTNKDLTYELLWAFVKTLSGRLRESNEKMKAYLALAGRF